MSKFIFIYSDYEEPTIHVINATSKQEILGKFENQWKNNLNCIAGRKSEYITLKGKGEFISPEIMNLEEFFEKFKTKI